MMTGICSLPVHKLKQKPRPESILDDQAQACPCGQGLELGHCCGPIIDGDVLAATAEALMRSRYTAYVREHREHLLRSWWPDTRPERLDFDSRQRWLGLTIRQVSAGSATDDEGSVEFLARFKIDGKAHRLHERSHFRRVAGQWLYVDGERLEKTT
ncbi:MAG: YchJ family protein [Pseudomonadales bacterium]